MKKIANYQLANTANYTFDIVKAGENVYDPAAYYYKEDFPDVELKRSKAVIDLEPLHSKFLITVNGYVHPTTYSDDRLYIRHATKSMLKSRSNAIGLLAVGKLSEQITKTAITADMISQETNLPAIEKVYITFPDFVMKPVLIMAGYMVFEDPEHFYRISDNTFALKLDRLQYIQKLYELNHYRDIFTELGIPVSHSNDSVFEAEAATSFETLVKFLTLHNSFVVDLHIEELTVTKVFLEHSTIPSTFWTEVKPTMPLIVGCGKLGEYSYRRGRGNRHTVFTQDNVQNNYLFSAQNAATIKMYNEHRRPGSTYRLSSGFFLELSTTV